jgi:hypothetical protein
MRSPRSRTTNALGVFEFARPDAPPGWEKLPRSVSEALTACEIDFAEHGLLTFLVGAINWQTGVYRGTLARLAEEVGWEHSQDWLRRKLLRLREDGWIEYESKAGQRSAYVIRLGVRVREGQRNRPAPGLSSDSLPRVRSEVSSNAPAHLNGQGADPSLAAGVSQPRTPCSLLDRDEDGDETETQTTEMDERGESP